MGINFNDLPKNLQTKLQPFMTVAKNVEDAINMAKQNGKWSPADEKALGTLNGAANWGRIMDEYAFDSSKADEYKKNLPEAQKQQKLEAARRNKTKKQEQKENRENWKSTLADAGKLLLALTPLGWASCSDINSEQNQGVYIDFGVLFSAIQSRLDDILKEMKGIRSDFSVQYGNLLNKVDTIINQHYQTKEELMLQVNQLAAEFMVLLNEIITNQKQSNADNNKHAEEIKKLLEAILNSQDDADVKLQKIYELIAKTKDIIVNIDTKLDGIMNQLAKMLDNDETIINALKKLDQNDQKTQKILTDIYNAINGLGSEFKAYFKDIIVQLSKGNVKLDNIEKLLKIINNNIECLKGIVTKYGNKGIDLGNAILNAIKNINISMPDVDLSGIEALLNQLVNGQKRTNDGVDNITKLLNNFSANTANQLNIIIAKLDKNSPDYSAQLNTIIELLEKLDANNETRNKKVLDAIDKLGVKISGDLTAIFNKIGKGGQEGKDYSSVLNAILAKLGNIDANNSNNFNRVIEALGKLSVGDKTDVDLKPVLDILEKILKAIKDHKVTVDVNGKVICECHCGADNTVHEGVLDDLTALLG